MKPSNLSKLLAEMNHRFAVVTMNNKVMILKDNGTDKPGFFSKSDFKTLTENEFVTLSKLDRKGNEYLKEEPISKWWLSHPDRKDYSGIEFSPGKDLGSEKYNLFSGWPYHPKGGLEDIPFFHELLVEVISSGNEKHANYIWSWLAHMIQKPWEKPGVSIVLRSNEQGVGKSSFVSYIGKLLGRHFLTVTQLRHLAGHFNSMHADAILIFSDEATSGYDSRSESVLKTLITEPTTILELKGKDSVSIRSCSRVVLATNDVWAAPVELFDRRYFVLDVPPVKKGNQEFFQSLINERDNGGAESLMNCCMQYNLKNLDLGKFPDTDARRKQKLLSMGVLHMWWFETIKDDQCLDGEFFLEDDQENRIPKLNLLRQLNEFIQLYRPKENRWSSSKLGMEIHKLVPNIETRRNQSNRREYVIPPLKSCREFFQEKYGIGFSEDGRF